MGFGNQFSSESQTDSRTQTQSGPVTTSYGSRATVLQQGGRSRSVGENAVALERNAALNVGGYQFGNIGKGAIITINAEDTGGGNLEGITSLLEAAIGNQASLSRQAVEGYSTLAETGASGGGNLASQTVTKAIFALAGVAALFLLVSFFRKRT